MWIDHSVHYSSDSSSIYLTVEQEISDLLGETITFAEYNKNKV